MYAHLDGKYVGIISTYLLSKQAYMYIIIFSIRKLS